MDKEPGRFSELIETMKKLRSPDGCPWDRKQTFETLRNNTIEETYELADAILNKDLDGIKEEAGDLLLHVVFYAKLGEEAKVAVRNVRRDAMDKERFVRQAGLSPSSHLRGGACRYSGRGQSQLGGIEIA